MPIQRACSYDGASGEHEYEGLDKYMAAYDEVNFPSKLIPIQQHQGDISDDYELTQFTENVPTGSDKKTVDSAAVASNKSTVM